MKLFPRHSNNVREKPVDLLPVWLPSSYLTLLDSLDGERKETDPLTPVADYVKKYVGLLLEITKEKIGKESISIYTIGIPHSNYLEGNYKDFYRRVTPIKETKLKNYIKELRQQDGNSIIIVGNEKVLGYGDNVERIRKELERNGFKVEVDDLTHELIMGRGKELSKLPEPLSKVFEKMRITLPPDSSNSANEENYTIITARVVRILKVIDEILKLHPTIK